jgi:subtilisin
MGFDNRAFTADLDPAAIEELRKNPAVEDVEEGGECHILTAEIPTYNPLAVNTDWGVARVPAAVAWALGYYGQGVKLCVIDTGIQKGNAAFWKDGETCYKGGYNMVAGTDDPEDDHDHGTYCCSMIAHQHTGLAGSYRGIAPSVDLYAVKVLDAKGSGTLANVAAGIDWARENGMHIISMSLGATGGIPALQQACDAAWYAGILVVCAAGNSGPDDDTVNWPAAYASTIAVAAVDYNEFVASFSSRGAEVEISAPGVAIVGALAGFTYGNYAVAGSSERYMCASGTSAACPHVAAAACLIKSWYPLATALELRTLLREHLRDL